jgi:hypothetical protein
MDYYYSMYGRLRPCMMHYRQDGHTLLSLRGYDLDAEDYSPCLRLEDTPAEEKWATGYSTTHWSLERKQRDMIASESS